MRPSGRYGPRKGKPIIRASNTFPEKIWRIHYTDYIIITPFTFNTFPQSIKRVNCHGVDETPAPVCHRINS